MKERLLLFARSIRFRLALWFVAILAVVLVAFSVFVYARQASDLNRATLERLSLKTRQWESYLKYAARDYFGEDPPLIPAQTQDGESFLQEYDILALVGLQGQVVQKAGPVQDEEIQHLVQVGLEKRTEEHPFAYNVVEATAEDETTSEEYRFVVAPITLDRKVIGFFLLGSPVDPNGQLQRLLVTLVLGNVVTLGLALAGGTLLAERAMRPVKMITRTAREIGESDLNRRLNLGTQDELGELANTFDAMLARLQAAFERQRQFTADASHELRTPLTIIGLETAWALSARRPAAEYERVLGVVQSENEFMTRLVNNLLTLSRMDAGQAGFNFEALDLSDLALEVLERLTPLAKQRGVSLGTGDLPEVKTTGDRQYLSQMLANLVENAIKYTNVENPQVRVETGVEPSGPGAAGFAWVRVEDNGPGIAPESLERIFDRFYQVDQARTRNESGDLEGDPTGEQQTSGSGLGLSIVQQIVQAHGGQVSARSEGGQGSTFTVRLPLAS